MTNLGTPRSAAQQEMESVECPICGRSDHVTLFLSPDREWGSKETFRFVQYTGCGLVRIDPRPTPRKLTRFYPPANWPRVHEGRDPLGATILGVPWRRIMEGRARVVLSVVKGPGRLLEIGGGDGYFLRYMQELGWEAEGIEQGEEAVRYARNHLGVTMHHGRIGEVKLPGGPYDLIYMHHAFEHLDDPLNTLLRLRLLLSSAGVLYLALPNWMSLDRILFRSCWAALKPPQHLFHYDRKSLGALLEKAGFRLVKTRTYSKEGRVLIGYQESFRYFLNGLGLYPDPPTADDRTPVPSGQTPTRSTPAWKRAFQMAEMAVWGPCYRVADALGIGTSLQAWARLA